jgi:metal-sulfur cluster biosynthetic enzyme
VIARAALWAALAKVRDPELDEPLPDLGFVAALEEDEGRVTARLRLPTYFCAPNFAYLMVADAKAALSAVPGVRKVDVELEDHFASDEINTGVGAGESFQGTFEGLADDELGDLRTLFNRKAFLVRLERLCREWLDGGGRKEDLASLRLADLPASAAAARYVERRAELGLDMSPDAPVVVTAVGAPVPRNRLDEHLRFARTIRISVEGNAGLCRGLLATRYGIPDPEEVAL